MFENSLCISAWKGLHFTFISKGYFAGYIIIGSRCLSSNILNIWFYCLLACRDSAKISNDHLMSWIFFVCLFVVLFVFCSLPSFIVWLHWGLFLCHYFLTNVPWRRPVGMEVIRCSICFLASSIQSSTSLGSSLRLFIWIDFLFTPHFLLLLLYPLPIYCTFWLSEFT